NCDRDVRKRGEEPSPRRRMKSQKQKRRHAVQRDRVLRDHAESEADTDSEPGRTLPVPERAKQKEQHAAPEENEWSIRRSNEAAQKKVGQKRKEQQRQ